ncbi:MAG: hypothetical protein WBL05_01400 [Brooklawnia sp.]|uniref:hypothetical protein n=1 Tax=Brooklawnia sp. TaxID=2699740 RepID=UPI003C74E8ED
MSSNDYLHLSMHNNRIAEFYQSAEHARLVDDLPVTRRSWLPRLSVRFRRPRKDVQLVVGHATMTA